MTINGWIQIALFCAVVLALVKPLGGYMTRVFTGERTLLSPVLGPVERGLYRARRHRRPPGAALARPTPSRCSPSTCSASLVLYALLRLQAVLPLNPAGQGAVAPDLAFNTAVSFVTNTNWQNYGGETHAVVPRPRCSG